MMHLHYGDKTRHLQERHSKKYGKVQFDINENLPALGRASCRKRDCLPENQQPAQVDEKKRRVA